jgi:hypothetical protein
MVRELMATQGRVLQYPYKMDTVLGERKSLHFHETIFLKPEGSLFEYKSVIYASISYKSQLNTI